MTNNSFFFITISQIYPKQKVQEHVNFLKVKGVRPCGTYIRVRERPEYS